MPSHGGEDGARGVFVAPICSSDAAEGFASSDASEGVKGLSTTPRVIAAARVVIAARRTQLPMWWGQNPCV